MLLVAQKTPGSTSTTGEIKGRLMKKRYEILQGEGRIYVKDRFKAVYVAEVYWGHWSGVTLKAAKERAKLIKSLLQIQEDNKSVKK